VRVRDVMSSPAVTVPPELPLKELADVLVERAISAVPVVEGGELVGIVSEADLLPLESTPDPRAHLAPLPEPPTGVPQVVAEVMTREVIALPEDADVAEASRLMLERGIRSIPVVRGRRVTGVVARRDLLKVLARSDDDIARELEALLAEELGAMAPYRVAVRDGVAELEGPADPTSRRLVGLLARGIPGVVGVRFRPEGSGEPHDGPAGSGSARRRPAGSGEPHDGPACSGSDASPSDGAEEAPMGREGAGEPRRDAPVDEES
jgi:CBS domain-containing protein